MPSFRTLLLLHGYVFVFGYVFAAQVGVPIPADPILLLMGALAGDGIYKLWVSLLLVTLAAFLADCIWYQLGRIRGRSVLSLLCRFSLEPDICIRKTELSFSKRGVWTVVAAKFIPGMGLLSMPLAGIIRMPFWRFALLDLAGCTLWSGCYLVLGFLFHRQVNAVIEWLGLFGRRAGIVFVALIGAYIALRYLQRWRFRRELRINKIGAQEAFDLISSGHPVTVVDLRNPIELEQEPLKIAGALSLQPSQLSARSGEIPRGNDVILYCSCPNETTSTRVALQLKRIGVRKVRPLVGGFDSWKKLNLPMEPYVAQSSAIPKA